jgi:hypothetical protein
MRAARTRGPPPPPPPATPANSSAEEEEEGEEEQSDGGQAPLRGGVPRPRRYGPQRQPWSKHPWRARRHLPLGHQWRRHNGAPQTLEEVEAGLLQLDVSSTCVFPFVG